VPRVGAAARAVHALRKGKAHCYGLVCGINLFDKRALQIPKAGVEPLPQLSGEF